MALSATQIFPPKSLYHTPRGKSRGHAVDKPLSHQGNLIENIEVRFENGMIVEAKASRGEDALIPAGQ